MLLAIIERVLGKVVFFGRISLKIYFFSFFALIFYTPAPQRGRGYTVLPVRLSFRPSKIFFIAFFSVTVDGRNLIFGHKLHLGTPYRG
jgi:hypothetical protein